MLSPGCGWKVRGYGRTCAAVRDSARSATGLHALLMALQEHYEPIRKLGMRFRLTESNDYLVGVPGGSNSFASALWALDFMHWWAEHGASGIKLP